MTGSGSVALPHFGADSGLAALGSEAGFVASNSLSICREPQASAGPKALQAAHVCSYFCRIFSLLSQNRAAQGLVLDLLHISKGRGLGVSWGQCQASSSLLLPSGSSLGPAASPAPVRVKPR